MLRPADVDDYDERLGDLCRAMAAMGIRVEHELSQPSVAVNGEPLLVSLKDSGAFLGVSESTVKNLANSGELLTVRIDRRRLVPMSALREYVRTLEDKARIEREQQNESPSQPR